MLIYFYAQPLLLILLLMAAGLELWGFFSTKIHASRWKFANIALSCISAVGILYITLLSRVPGNTSLILTPFAALAAARHQPELYREMLMNVFLFFPLGLTLSNALPQGWNHWRRIALTMFAACIFSACIEFAQYRFALGVAEVDDIICNTLGAFVGSTSLLIEHAVKKRRERRSNMKLTATEAQFVQITKAAISGGALPSEIGDWVEIFKIASQQKLLPILFEAVRSTPAAEENAALFAAVRQQVIGQVINQAVRTAEFTALYRRLRAAGLHPVVVKGQLCSRLYPLRNHRISADDDLLIGDREFFACHEALLANGLATGAPADALSTADEVSYTKKESSLYIELHRCLFDSSEDAHDDLNGMFAGIAPVESDGLLTLPPQEHLLYLILHAYKHFVCSGIGLRQFCDIGLWAQTYNDKIDWQRLHECCAAVHAATFASAAFRIARTYLGIAFDLPAPWNDEVDAEPLLHDTVCGGVYGSNDYTRLHSSTVTLNAVKANRAGKKAGLLRTVFPKRTYLEQRYPYLKPRPYLLPIAWMQRMIHYVGEKRSRTDNSAAGSIKLAKERIELMKLYDIIE